MNNEYEYEKVKTKDRVPAKIVYFNSEMLKNWKFRGSKNFLPIHWHRSLEITMITKGTVKLKVANEEKIINESEFVLVNSGILHTLSTEDSKELEGLVVIISYDFMKETYPNIDKIYFDIHKDESHLEAIRELFYKLTLLSLHNDEFAYIKINAHLLELLYILVKFCSIPHSDEQQHIYKKFLSSKQFVLDYIEEHYNEELSLEKVASEFSVSSVHFSRAFFKIFGIHYKAYVTNFRIYKAYEDVLYSDKTIQQISLLHGFPNVKSFIREFQKIYLVTPYQYRKSKKDNFIDNQ